MADNDYHDHDGWNALDWAALVLVIIGALNWGLVGLGMLMDTDLNVVDILFGSMPTVEAVIYLIIGLAGLYTIWTAYKAGRLL